MSRVNRGFFSNKPEFSTILGMIKLAQNYKEFQITKKNYHLKFLMQLID